MDRLKSALRKISQPPWWFFFIAVPSAVVLLVVGLSKRFEGSALSYISYLFSSYTLYVVVRNVPRFLRWVDGKVRGLGIVKKLSSTKYGSLYINDMIFRGTASIYPGLIINFSYSIFRFVTALIYDSGWFAAIGMYYFLLGVIRLVMAYFLRRENIFADRRERKLYEYRRCIISGLLMFAVNIAMTSMVFMMTFRDFHYTYPSYLIYFSVAHAFYTIISSVISYFKYRKYDNSILSTAKAVSVSGGLMSLFIAQDALLTAFRSGGSFEFWTGFITGGIFIFASNIMAVVTIFKALIRMEKIKRQYSSN